MDFSEYEKKIEFQSLKLKRLKREDIISKARSTSNKSKEKKRKRDHDLIMRGALFETVGLLSETPEALLGFLMDNLESYEDNKEKYFKIGYKELESRNRNTVKMVGEKEIKELLNFSLILKDKDIDMMLFIQKKFKKKLYEQLTYDEFLTIKNLSEI